MGCGLRKLEDPDDSSPGKIFSTLKRPQVETKTDSTYEYLLLDFTLEVSSSPEVIKINSFKDIANKVEEYYIKGYVVGAVHPIILSTGRRRHLPVSYLYRVVLFRLKLSQKHMTPRGQRRPRLVIEEWPLLDETLTKELVKGLLEKVNEAAKRGMRFIGFVMQHYPHTRSCNSTNKFTGGDEDTDIYKRSQEHRSQNADENSTDWTKGTLSGQSSESRVDEEKQQETGYLQDAVFQFGREGSPLKLEKAEGNKLYAVFNAYEDDSICWSYLEGHLSMKVTRKGTTISTLEADWLELTTFYYKQGLSLIDSFIYWENSKGDQLPKSLEGLFIYEDEGSGVPGSNRKGNDAIIVEQWTVIEGCEIKTDYGPLLHALAEFGWLLTCVLPTPIVRHDSEGNLATKQIVFLQRPVIITSASQTTDKKSPRHIGSEERSRVSSRSIGLHTATPRALESTHLSSDEFQLSSSKQCWSKEGPLQYRSFSGFSSSDSVLRELDDGQFEQEDGVTQVTCM
ncbi:raftlin-2 [Rhinatrema bivittatum]|uniref:raftlin-2 n=1 Tax=Rhinatrema bivittatum TaxID=194408 RepID=UPI001126CCC5|nr:raftlin-2 [Rhinatrema bivittatum]XP_029461904.1 raftlin-2 [Rhinatrema bivittatum]